MHFAFFNIASFPAGIADVFVHPTPPGPDTPKDPSRVPDPDRDTVPPKDPKL